MAQNFIACDREQELLLPPSLREWLREEHLAWFVLEAVAEMDLAAFVASYRDDGWGRAAHDPAMMVALLIYAYAIGVRSSRAIERHCREDVAFRVITANRAPDHATIARFRVRHEAAIAELFGEVLGLCARSGLVRVGVVAVDGTKIAAAATHHATRSYEQIAREILEEAARIDAAEDELYGEERGDELPEGLRTSGDRRKVLREAKRALEAERAAQAKKIPRGRTDRLRECRRRLRQDWELERHVVTEHAAWHAAGIASDGSRRMGGARHNNKPYPLTPEPAGKINITDPDSRKPQDDARLGAGLQRPGRGRRRPDRARRRDQRRVAGHRQPAADGPDRNPRARGGRRDRHTRGGVGRRRLLQKRRHRDARLGGHPDARRAGRRPAQGTPARSPRRALRLRPPHPRDRLGQG